MAMIKLDKGSYIRIDFLSNTCFRLRMSNFKDFSETNPYARYGIFDFSGDGTKAEVSDRDGCAVFATENSLIKISGNR